jgi:hypothetical protein
LLFTRSPRSGNSQSREDDEVGFDVITAGGTGWVWGIRYYDCPKLKTTTFPVLTSENEKRPWRTMAL